MKTIIAGGRNINDSSLVNKVVQESGIEITEVVSGGAGGVDSLGERWAFDGEICVKRFSANWSRYGPSAGPRRNREMAEYADALILVWDGKSRGSANMLAEAKKRNLMIYEFIVKEKVDE